MRTSKGFTLIELVVGIVVLAIAMMVMNTMLISQSKDALEPLYRLRASQLGQDIMQDILSQDYDDDNDTNDDYDDVDDFVIGSFTSVIGSDVIKVVFGDALPSQYNNYYLKIAIDDVDVDADSDSTTADIVMKRIDVTIKTPSDEEIIFSALKGNY